LKINVEINKLNFHTSAQHFNKKGLYCESCVLLTRCALGKKQFGKHTEQIRLSKVCEIKYMINNLFNSHIYLYISWLGINYNNIYGFILFIIFIIQFITGLLLSFYYSSFISLSFNSIFYIIFDINLGYIIRLLHLIGSFLFIFIIYFHFLRYLWLSVNSLQVYRFAQSTYRMMGLSNFNLIYITGIIILVLSLIISFIGYCLIWGQMSMWGIIVILNIFTILPYPLSILIFELIYCSSNLIIYRFFILHFGLSFILLFFIFLHLFILHVYTSSNPLFNINSSWINSFYLMIIKDFYLFIVFYVIFLIYILFFNYESLSNPINNIIANPLSTPLHILPEPYFLLIYCILRSLPSKIYGIIVILCFFYLLLLG
jgi:ubiquinol-cytochrome c reductase cytochrome b subunit